MAKTAMKVKQQRKQKFSTREYSRCNICGRPHAYLRKYGICRICFRELAYKGEIADLLTRIRNANAAKHDSVEIPASNLKKSICQILLDEGYIKNFTVIEDGKQGIIKVTLKYLEGKRPVITGLRRVSKPGLRIYSNAEDMPKVMKGLGVAVISTSKGVMTDREARKQHIGGEVLAYIW